MVHSKDTLESRVHSKDEGHHDAEQVFQTMIFLVRMWACLVDFLFLVNAPFDVKENVPSTCASRMEFDLVIFAGGAAADPLRADAALAQHGGQGQQRFPCPRPRGCTKAVTCL